MLVGVVPMGGWGERWSPYPCPKELLPFGVDSDGRPRVIGDFVIDCMVGAGVELVVIPVRAEKATQVLGYFGATRKNSPPIVFVAAPGPSLVANLRVCTPLLRGHTVLFGMPDTYFSPRAAFSACLGELRDGAEVVLGCWNHPDPSGLDTVVRQGNDLAGVNPKPRLVDDGSREAWGIATWTAAFTDRLAAWIDPERHNPGFIFQAAALEGRARGVAFPAGKFEDLGNYAAYEASLIDLSTRPDLTDEAIRPPSSSD